MSRDSRRTEEFAFPLHGLDLVVNAIVDRCDGEYDIDVLDVRIDDGPPLDAGEVERMREDIVNRIWEEVTR